MKKSKIVKMMALAVCSVAVAASASACTDKGNTSLRTQLETPTELAFNWEEGTMSFKAVENATYYRVYFYNVTEPSDTIGNTDYFKSHTETQTETYPDGNTSEKEVTVYDTDENGNYVTYAREEILTMSPTYSKRYAATYMDENDDKHAYNAGETVTFDLPNDSVGGGNYYIAVKAGGPIALYTLSEYVCTPQPVSAIMHNVDPEISLDYSNTFNQYGTKTSTSSGPFGSMESNTVDTENEVLDGTGMMFEISNAETFYNANANIQLTYHIKDSSGNDVPFSFVNVKMKRNDSNTFCGWEVKDQGSSVTSGTASVSHYIYSHSGPTMEYQTSGFFYITGLTEGETYTLYITAPGDNGETSYDSGESSFEFEFAVTEWTADSSSGGGSGGGGFPGGDMGGGGFPGGDQNSDSDATFPEGGGDQQGPPSE